jgi:hypothetical protein
LEAPLYLFVFRIVLAQNREGHFCELCLGGLLALGLLAIAGGGCRIALQALGKGRRFSCFAS